MALDNSGGYAFASNQNAGMTLFDFYAAAALAICVETAVSVGVSDKEQIANEACDLAAAMVVARRKYI